MSNEAQAALINEIGELILNDPVYQAEDWLSLGFVVTLDGGTRRMTGYKYLEGGLFEASTPDQAGDVIRKMRALKENMTANADGDFVQCLIHITKPDYKLRMQFEFDDVKRWAPKSIGMDMSDFAESLRPE